MDLITSSKRPQQEKTTLLWTKLKSQLLIVALRIQGRIPAIVPALIWVLVQITPLSIFPCQTIWINFLPRLKSDWIDYFAAIWTLYIYNVQLHCTHKIHYLHKGAVQDSGSTLLNQPCWFNSCNFVLSFTGNSIHWVCSKLRASPHFWKSDLRCTIIKPECWNQALLIP